MMVVSRSGTSQTTVSSQNSAKTSPVSTKLVSGKYVNQSYLKIEYHVSTKIVVWFNKILTILYEAKQDSLLKI